MKVARFSRVRPVLTVGELFGSTDSGPSQQVPTATGSNGNPIIWGSNVANIFSNTSNQITGPTINFLSGSGIAFAASSNTLTISATSGGATLAYGSNASRVAEIPSVGASTSVARTDHIHDGIGTITASSSNTLQRGTVNLRAGAGIALSLTDTDGDGEFDTTTIVNTRAAGTTTSGTNLGWYNVKDYGAVGDGVTNDSAAIQAAIDAVSAAGGGTAFAPAGTYLLSTALALKSNVRLLGSGRGTILQKNDSNSGTCAIESTGTLGTTVTLTATSAPTYGTTTVSAATNPASLVAGDFVLIRDDTYTNSPSGRNQEINRIRSVSGAFTFTLVNRLIGTYTTGGPAQMLKLTPVNSSRVEALQVYVPGNAPTTIVQSGGCIGFDLAYDCTVVDVDLRGAYHLPGIRVLRSAHLVFDRVDIRDGQDITNGSGYGYGVNIGESSHDCIVTQSYFENIRENDFTNNARNCTFSNNVARRTEIHTISTHGAGGGRMVIANNNIHGSGQNAIDLHSNTIAATDTDILVIGNYIEDTNNYHITCGAASSGNLAAVNIVGNYFGANSGAGDGYMITVGPLAIQVSIRGNTFDNTNGGTMGAAILVNNNAAAANITDTVIADNDFRNITGKGIYLGKATRTIIRNNHFTAVSSYNIDSSTIGGGVDTWVYDNTADDNTNLTLAADRWWGNAWGTAAAGLAQNPRVYALASSHGISSTTATEVTGLGPVTLEAGTYVYQYTLIAQSATTSVGIGLGINFTGTAATRTILLEYPGSGTSATGIIDDVGAGTGQAMEHNVQTAYTTASPNMINTNGFITANANTYIRVSGIVVVTVAGDLELWHSSETATSTTVMAGSSLIVTRTV